MGDEILVPVMFSGINVCPGGCRTDLKFEDDGRIRETCRYCGSTRLHDDPLGPIGSD